MYAPTVNSYKRYQPESWAPTALAWSVDNRTCGFRVVGHGPSFRLESRIPGADVNPYLAYAATIAAGLARHRARARPAAALRRQRVRGRPTLPRVPSSLVEAIDAFEQSKVAADAFGADVHDHLLNTARQEWLALQPRRSPTGNAAATSTSGEPRDAPLVAVTGPPARASIDEVAVHGRGRVAARLPRRSRPRGRRSPSWSIPSATSTRLLDRVDALVLTGGPDVDPALLRRGPRTPRCTASTAPPTTSSSRWRAPRSNARPRRSRSVAASRCSTSRSAARCTSTSPTCPASSATADPARRAAGGEHGIDVDARVAARDGDGHRRAVTGSCHHHQAVDKVGDGPARRRRAPTTASSKALELDGTWLLAVQWHPEDTAADRPRAAAPLRRASGTRARLTRRTRRRRGRR